MRFIAPMLPSLVDEPPDGDDWIHEIKHDGYRTELIIDAGQIRAFTRNAFDWTDRYLPLSVRPRLPRLSPGLPASPGRVPFERRRPSL